MNNTRQEQKKRSIQQSLKILSSPNRKKFLSIAEIVQQNSVKDEKLQKIASILLGIVRTEPKKPPISQTQIKKHEDVKNITYSQKSLTIADSYKRCLRESTRLKSKYLNNFTNQPKKQKIEYSPERSSKIKENESKRTIDEKSEIEEEQLNQSYLLSGMRKQKQSQ